MDRAVRKLLHTRTLGVYIIYKQTLPSSSPWGASEAIKNGAENTKVVTAKVWCFYQHQRRHLLTLTHTHTGTHKQADTHTCRQHTLEPSAHNKLNK